MTWYKNLGIIITPIIVSSFYFPVSINVLPGLNTKMALALVGCLIVAFQMGKRSLPTVDRQLFVISMWALSVSFITFVSMTYNETADNTYLTYIISMYVWLVAAYALVAFIRWVHGKYTLKLISNYLIAVCVGQCALALAIDQFKPLKIFVSKYIIDTSWLESVDRLYGIGAELDTAGVRFSVAIVLLVYLLKNASKYVLEKYVPVYLAAFLVLVVVGNMIARTTSVGVVVGMLYLIYIFVNGRVGIIEIDGYRHSHHHQACQPPPRFLQRRSAFEGFFNLFEKGEWYISSNETLKGMYVFPESLKTWIIGDGYIVNPKFDPYYTGEVFTGYYKNTDVGYLRFIFYFGVTGLLLFAAFILQVGRSCIQKFPQHGQLVFLLIVVNFIVWFKVSTDIFLAFALLLFLDEENEEQMQAQLRCE